MEEKIDRYNLQYSLCLKANCMIYLRRIESSMIVDLLVVMKKGRREGGDCEQMPRKK